MVISKAPVTGFGRKFKIQFKNRRNQKFND